jgi:hypothetical protein
LVISKQEANECNRPGEVSRRMPAHFYAALAGGLAG